MSNVAALSARVDALRKDVAEADGYAQACRTTASRLDGTVAALSGTAVHTGSMRSRSARVERATGRVESAADAIRSVRSALDGACDDLHGIARRYERRADAARADLRVAQAQLAAAVQNGAG
ncbi:hypothetical protein [Micromonospora sagamiensis]|uniref:Uncharacterized protein n=1 Tax=Micromonospora sagamiensis TaxID=47875 RepID=A0A562W9J6_9ACTN|nr:hypothetical protein [Micromonospora sagamiensis]TWJ26661.1 hypothetical protein JD81_00123 [Micromonospora sagamiensis]BCL14453.1 hypothetical protein GCM10017556_21920 [Micromonospora sagamiensis]